MIRYDGETGDVYGRGGRQTFGRSAFSAAKKLSFRGLHRSFLVSRSCFSSLTLPVPTRSRLNSIYGRCAASETIVPSTGGYLYLDRCRFIRFQDNIPPFDPVPGNKLSSTRKRFSHFRKMTIRSRNLVDLYKEYPREIDDLFDILFTAILIISLLIRTLVIHALQICRTNRNLQGTVKLDGG